MSKLINPDGENFKTQIDEKKLQETLDPLSYDVLRNGATERPFTGEYTDAETVGSYRCKACASELFKSGLIFMIFYR